MKKFIVKYKSVISAFLIGLASYHGLSEYTPVIDVILDSVRE